MKYLKACLLRLTALHATRSRHPPADFHSLQRFREDHKGHLFEEHVSKITAICDNHYNNDSV